MEHRGLGEIAAPAWRWSWQLGEDGRGLVLRYPSSSPRLVTWCPFEAGGPVTHKDALDLLDQSHESSVPLIIQPSGRYNYFLRDGLDPKEFEAAVTELDARLLGVSDEWEWN